MFSSLSFSYHAFSINIYWKSSLSLGFLCQGLWLSADLGAGGAPVGVRVGGLLLCRTLDGLHWLLFALMGWQRPVVMRRTGRLL